MKKIPCSRSAAAVRGLFVCVLLAALGLAAPDALAQRGGRPAPAAPAAGLTEADTSIGLRLKATRTRAGASVTVDAIVPGSRIEHMNVQTGSALLFVLDQPVTSLDQACALIENWAAAPDGPLSLVLEHGRAKSKVMLFPIGAEARPSAPTGRGAGRGASAAAVTTSTEQALAAKRLAIRERRSPVPRGPVVPVRGEALDPWVIPGLAERPAAASRINVLHRVFIDPQTGELAFVGRYDPAFATGTIDYSTLLHDALLSPAPSFSLEPTAATKTAVASFARQFDQQMAANLSNVAAGKAWLTGIFDQLLTNPALETDRQRFLARGAELLHVPASDVPTHVQAMLGRTPMGSPPWVNFWAQAYQTMGAPEAAAYIRAAANKENDPAAFQGALDLLGLRPTINDLTARLQSRALTESVAYARLEVAIWAAIYSRCGVPARRWQAAGDSAGRTGDTRGFRTVIDELNADLVRERIIEPWLNDLVFTEQFLQQLHSMPALVTQPVCRDGLAPDSELARTFLAADWTLKNLTVTPELAARVPGHLTPTQFLFREEAARGNFDHGGVQFRLWLTPETVTLRHDAAGSVVEFRGGNPGLRAEVLEHTAVASAGSRLTREMLPAYALEISRRYDDYARALPELHRLREAAKLLALVRWAHERGLHLVPPESPAPPRSLPASFQRGFWSAFFLAQNGHTFLGLSASGGVDFSAGGDWVRSSVAPEVKESALGQLLGSAALGRAAVDAAASGDLESARALADQSARAMTGDFDISGQPALPQVPEASPPSPVDAALIQTEVLAQTRQDIDTMERAQKTLRQTGAGDLARAEAHDQWSRAEEHLAHLHSLLAAGASPLPAKQVVQLLRAGDWESLPKPQPPAVATAAPTPPAPTPAPPSPPVVDPEERARLRGEITQLRTELCRIQTQLRRFNATIQSDQDQRADWEKVTNDAYESALKRAQEKFEDFSVDFPGDILKEKLEKATDPAERAKIERALRLVDRFKDAYTTRDFSDWAAKEEFTREEIVEGIKQIMEICEVEQRIKDYLSKKWGLKRAIAYYEAGDDILTSAYDVTAEVVAWRRLKQLNQNSDSFLKATEASGRRLRKVVAEIHAREVQLGLDPGSTKEPCAAP
ncbi:MAG: hypothetical protein HYV96_12925 [Opitutae bacterium]|nr:hypothetical protein [Opitutae bacterium]